MESSINELSSLKQPTISESQSAREAEWSQRIKQDQANNRRLAHQLWLGGPVPYAKYTFAEFDPNLNGTHQILKACLDFDPTKRNLFILGGQGKGKTHLSTAIAHRVLDNGGRGRVFRGKELAAFVKGRRNYSTDHDELDAISDLAVMNVVVVDDIEDGPDRESYQAAVKNVLEKRKNEGRYGFIITSNKTIAELSGILGAKIADRIEGDFDHLIIPDSVPSARPLLKRLKKIAPK